jgi:hypothetical protein
MAKKKADADEQILALIQEVARRKEEIAKLEKPNWKTNCYFLYEEVGDSRNNVHANQGHNLHVFSDVSRLILMAAFLKDRSNSYLLMAQELGVENPPPFKWNGFSLEDWLEDIKTRINKIQIAAKKTKLADLENRLNKIISPETRRKMELEAIAKELA